jgi:hypothetical protein
MKEKDLFRYTTDLLLTHMEQVWRTDKTLDFLITIGKLESADLQKLDFDFDDIARAIERNEK